jgi:hypothetical protein
MPSKAATQGLSAPPPPPDEALLEPLLEEELLLDDELDDELLEEEDDEELVTLSVALALLTVPAELVSTQRNWSPDIASVGAKSVSVGDATPE